jgi:hypothetical protein
MERSLTKPAPITDIAESDYQARIFVCGWRRATTADGETKTIVNASGWNTQFKVHPWVRESNAEGWARNLRQHIVRVVASRMRNGQDFYDIDQLMPPGDLREFWRKQALRVAKGEEFRKQIAERFGSYDNFLGRGKPQRKTSWQGVGSALSSKP